MNKHDITGTQLYLKEKARLENESAKQGRCFAIAFVIVFWSACLAPLFMGYGHT